MTLDYQLNMLGFLVQHNEGVKYIDDLSEDIFDLLEHKLCLQLLKKYKKLYNVLPGKVTAMQYLEEQMDDTRDVSAEVSKLLRETMEDIFYPIAECDKVKIHDTIILEVQEKQIDSAFMDHAAGKLSVTQVLTKINKLSGMVKSVGYDEHSKGGFLIADRDKHLDERIHGEPTFLYDLNHMTAAGGFYSPQLIVFMSGPKAFKTGTILKIGVEYARGGLKVYYADNENGATQIRNRAKMAVMECELSELFDPSIQDELSAVLKRFGYMMGGDIFIDEYQAYKSSMNDIKGRLDYLKTEFGWVPDLIILDDIDKFMPNNLQDRGRDSRIRIQLVYAECINLNKEIGCFSIVPSQVNRAAIGKAVFKTIDLAEDFAKVMNAHSVWAICMTPEEEAQGIRRIIPVAQREGVSYKGKNVCIVKVDEKRMIVEEVDAEEYLKNVTDE